VVKIYTGPIKKVSRIAAAPTGRGEGTERAENYSSTVYSSKRSCA